MSKAENLMFPYRVGTSADTPVLYIACTTTHAAILVPTVMRGKFVKLLNESSTTTDFVDFFFSNDNTSEVDRSVASSASGATSPKLGDRLYGTQSVQGLTPSIGDPAVNLYLIVESSASLNLRVTLTELALFFALSLTNT
jgi:hypothetical protein